MTNNLRIALTDSAVEIKLEISTSFPNSGYVQIEDEIIQYTYSSDLFLLNCTRGVNGTVAVAHDAGTEVTYLAALPADVIGLDLDGQTLDAEIRFSNGIKLTVSGDVLTFTNAAEDKSATITLA
jgi:hypothetical protein